MLMSKHRKLREKLLADSIPSNVTWDEMRSYLEHIGYKLLKSRGGSSRKFYHKEKDALFCCHQPHQPACVDKGCLGDLIEHLKINGLM